MENSIKEDIKKRYSKIVMSGNTDCCCMPGECSSENSPMDATKLIGYDQKDLESIPQEAILGVGCGAPLNHADLKEGETVVDLGSGAGIDIFLASKKVSDTGKAIGIDMTDQMLEKARENAAKGKYSNVEFKKGDIEENIPLDRNSVDAVISNCVINLTTNKANAFKEVFRILKNNGRMVISDLITDVEQSHQQISPDQWCECIDGAMTKENYVSAIRQGGFEKVEILEERRYMEGEKINGRKISSLVIKATKLHKVQPPKPEPKKKILFACVENSGRSQMAEAFFQKYAPKEYEAISGGTNPKGHVNPLVTKVMTEIGIDITGQKSKAISEDMIKSSAKAVNMGCMDKEVCPAVIISKMIDWDIEDPKDQPIEKIRKIRDEIEQKVKELLDSCNNQ